MCSQMMSPESAAKFSHHLTQEMVFGRASTGFFFLFSASEAPTPPPPPPPPQPLSFCICNLIDGAFFLPLHPAPNLAKVTGLTWAIPKRELGIAVDELKQSSGTAVTSK